MPSTPEQAAALVRLNISDLDPDNPILTDEQIESLLDNFDGSINRASARALRIIAASEVLIGKVIRTQDLSTDGRAVAYALRELAADYDRAAEADDAETEGAINLVPFGVSRRPREAEEWRW